MSTSNGRGPIIAIPRWKAPTWERTGYYMDSIEIAGGRPRLVEEKKLPAEAGALLVMGGVDVNPNLYGEKRGAHTDRPNNERDAHEMALLQDALERDIPVLAICRGHQLLNVALGGTLLQHIEGDAHKWTTDGDSVWHEIDVTEPASRLARAYAGEQMLRVNSRHHQGVTKDRLAGDLRPVAASGDAFVEAAESMAHRWVMGVQWHPERPEMRPEAAPLFAALIEATGGD
ncbi:MAG TPA: gamma-glutamyl-gamma-aminobutyrate hydrolase family protein [Dehalococcoidia bacterium]|nr:gamma-glutamyl-gamma-aminobutyrate hydrolase family protein [Dehalococcoidia bacterium]